MVYTHALNCGPVGVRNPVDVLSGKYGGLVPIHIRCGDENNVLSQRLDISAIVPESNALLAGVSYGNRSRVWGVTRIYTDNVGRNKGPRFHAN